jgi:NitT/TauT family transport system substrate-binding protein
VDALAAVISIGLFNAVAQGAPVRIVADKGRDPGGCSYRALLGRRALVERGLLASPAQLRGRRVAMNPMSIAGFVVDSLLGTAGLTLDDITAVNLPLAAQRDALESGAVDLVATGEPWVTRIRQGGHGVVSEGARFMPGVQEAVLIYGPSLLRDRPDVGRRFMAAYLAGVRRYNEGKTDRNLRLLAARTGLDTATLRQICWPAIAPDGRIDVPSVLAFERWAVRRGHLARAAGEAEFWEPAFASAAGAAAAAVASARP